LGSGTSSSLASPRVAGTITINPRRAACAPMSPSLPRTFWRCLTPKLQKMRENRGLRIEVSY